MVLPDGPPISQESIFAPAVARVSLLSLRNPDNQFMIQVLPPNHPYSPNKIDLITVEVQPEEGNNYGAALRRHCTDLGLITDPESPFPFERLGYDRSIQFYPGKTPPYRDTRRVFYVGDTVSVHTLDDFLNSHPGYRWMSLEEFKNTALGEFRRPSIHKAITTHIERNDPEVLRAMTSVGSISPLEHTFNTANYDDRIDKTELADYLSKTIFSL